MRPATLAELSDHYGLPAPLQPDGTFPRFIALYRAACEALRSPDDLARLVREIVEDAAAAGAVWVEPSAWLTAAEAARVGLRDEEAILEVLLDAAHRAARDTQVGVGLMVSSNRVHPPADAMPLARLAARYAGRGVVAFGLADDETRGPPEPFAAGLRRRPRGGTDQRPARRRARRARQRARRPGCAGCSAHPAWRASRGGSVTARAPGG